MCLGCKATSFEIIVRYAVVPKPLEYSRCGRKKKSRTFMIKNGRETSWNYVMKIRIMIERIISIYRWSKSQRVRRRHRRRSFVRSFIRYCVLISYFVYDDCVHIFMVYNTDVINKIISSFILTIINENCKLIF